MTSTNESFEYRKSLRRNITGRSGSNDKIESNKTAKSITTIIPQQKKTIATETGNINTPLIANSMQQCNTIEELNSLITLLSNTPPLINTLQFNINYPTSSSNSNNNSSSINNSNSSTNNVISASYSYQSSTILTGHSNGAIRLWNIDDTNNSAGIQCDTKNRIDISQLELPPLSIVDSALFNPNILHSEKFNSILQR